MMMMMMIVVPQKKIDHYIPSEFVVCVYRSGFFPCFFCVIVRLKFQVHHHMSGPRLLFFFSSSMMLMMLGMLAAVVDIIMALWLVGWLPAAAAVVCWLFLFSVIRVRIRFSMEEKKTLAFCHHHRCLSSSSFIFLALIHGYTLIMSGIYLVSLLTIYIRNGKCVCAWVDVLEKHPFHSSIFIIFGLCSTGR